MWSAQPAGTSVVLSTGEAFQFGLLILGGLLLIGLLIVLWRNGSPDKESVSLVRGWIAIGLLFGLLLFCLLSFTMSDGGLRNTLIGGLTASVGAAIAFYYSSKSSEQARKDLKEVMDTVQVRENVPDLVGMTFAEAEKAMARTSLKLVPDPAAPPPDQVVLTQDPAAGMVALVGAPVKATFGPRP